MADLIDTDKSGGKLELLVISLLCTEWLGGWIAAYHVVSQRDDNKLRVLGSLFDVGGHDGDL
jgi:hypothetical protein